MNVPTELERAEYQTDSSTMLQLRVSSGEQKDETLRLDRRISTIGVASTCSLQLASETLSPCHCVIVRGAAGVIVRRWSDDTQLNGQSFFDAWLHPGDALQLGAGPEAIELAVDLDEPQSVETEPNELQSVESQPCQKQTHTTQANKAQTSELQQVCELLSAAELREADALRRLQELYADVQQSKSHQAELEQTRMQLVTDNEELTERLSLLQDEHHDALIQLAAVTDVENLLEDSQLERQRLCDELAQLETQFEALKEIEQRYEQLALEHSALLEEQQNFQLAGKEWEQLLESERSTWQAEIQAATEANRELQRKLDVATTQLIELQQKLDTTVRPSFGGFDAAQTAEELNASSGLHECDAFTEMMALDDGVTPDFSSDEAATEESLGTFASAAELETPTLISADGEFDAGVEDDENLNAETREAASQATEQRTEDAAESLWPADSDVLDECRAEPYLPPRFLSPDQCLDMVDDAQKPVLESQLPHDDGTCCEALHRPATDTIGMLQQSSEALPERYGRIAQFDSESQPEAAEASTNDDFTLHDTPEPSPSAEEQTLDQYMAGVIGEIRSREVETQVPGGESMDTASARRASSDDACVSAVSNGETLSANESRREVDESVHAAFQPSKHEASRSVVEMDLAAMRNVANQSARNNIETHDERKNRQSVLALWGITLTLFAVSVGLIWMYRLDASQSSVLYQAILALVGSLICGVVARVVGGKLIATGTSAQEQIEAADD